MIACIRTCMTIISCMLVFVEMQAQTVVYLLALVGLRGQPKNDRRALGPPNLFLERTGKEEPTRLTVSHGSHVVDKGGSKNHDN